MNQTTGGKIAVGKNNVPVHKKQKSTTSTKKIQQFKSVDAQFIHEIYDNGEDELSSNTSDSGKSDKRTTKRAKGKHIRFNKHHG